MPFSRRNTAVKQGTSQIKGLKRSSSTKREKLKNNLYKLQKSKVTRATTSDILNFFLFFIYFLKQHTSLGKITYGINQKETLFGLAQLWKRKNRALEKIIASLS